jgi:hypothetical protein
VRRRRTSDRRLAGLALYPHAPVMFIVNGAETAAIRAIFHERGEFAAAVELRRLLPGITDTAQARECARTTADWKPVQSLQSGHSAIN